MVSKDQVVGVPFHDVNFFLFLASSQHIALAHAQQATLHVQNCTANSNHRLDRIDQKNLPRDGEYRYDYTGKEVSVYFLDTGLDISNSEFEARASCVLRVPWGCEDFEGHGTSVAGIVGSSEYGVAKEATLVGVKVTNFNWKEPFYWDLANAIKAIIQRKRRYPETSIVINVSGCARGLDAEQTVNVATSQAVAEGIVVVAAAGNSNESACNIAPANNQDVITVGAVDSTSDKRESGTNYGDCIDIFAPTGGSSTGTKQASDTSHAAPVVAGAVALVLEKYPAWSPAQVKDFLLSNGVANVLSDLGPGSPNLLLNTESIHRPLCNIIKGAAEFGGKCLPAEVCGARGGLAALSWHDCESPGDACCIPRGLVCQAHQEARTGQCEQSCPNGTENIQGPDVCPDGLFCCYGQEEKTSDSLSWVRVGQTVEGDEFNDYFGMAIAMAGNGNILAVGAKRRDDNGLDAGHVRVLELVNGTSWTALGQSLVGHAAGDHFGASVSLSDDGMVMAVTAPYNDESGLDAGQVVVFRYDTESNEWIQLGQRVNGLDAHNRLGFSLSLSENGSILAIGTPFAQKGHVRVFELIDDGKEKRWFQMGQTLVGQARNDNFGQTISLSSDGMVVAVGESRNDANGLVDAGQALVFSYGKNKTWVQLGASISGSELGDYFGRSVSLSSDGTIVAVAASVGYVRVFERLPSNDTWTQMGQTLVGPSFALSLSSDGMVLAMGSYLNGNEPGQALVFRYHRSSDKWLQVGESLNGTTSNDLFGASISLSSDGSVLAIGAPVLGSEHGNSKVLVFAYE